MHHFVFQKSQPKLTSSVSQGLKMHCWSFTKQTWLKVCVLRLFFPAAFVTLKIPPPWKRSFSYGSFSWKNQYNIICADFDNRSLFQFNLLKEQSFSLLTWNLEAKDSCRCWWKQQEVIVLLIVRKRRDWLVWFHEAPPHKHYFVKICLHFLFSLKRGWRSVMFGTDIRLFIHRWDLGHLFSAIWKRHRQTLSTLIYLSVF